MFNSRASVGKAILLSLLFLLVFYAIYIALYFLAALLFSLVSHIPVLSNIFKFLFDVRGDSPSFFVPILCAVVAYSANRWIMDKLAGDEPATFKLIYWIAGIILILANVVFLIMNIVDHSKFAVLFTDIIFIITGIVTVITAKNTALCQ